MITISQSTIAKLKANWGDKAEALDCKAELRVYDPLSRWVCYIFAMNPANENEIKVLVSLRPNMQPMMLECTLDDINLRYNQDGEHMEVDAEYRPRDVSTLFIKLSEGYR